MNRGLRLVPSPQPPPPGPPASKPEVIITANTAENVDALDVALGLAAPDLFQRGNVLVEVLGEKRAKFVAEGAPVLRPVTKHALAVLIDRHLVCQRYTPPTKAAIQLARVTPGAETPGGGMQPCRAPGETAILPMLAYGRWQHIRPITGIVEAPFFRPDGAIWQSPGHDGDTGYLYQPNTDFPRVPDQPTQEDARKALLSLQHVFCDFPYTSPAAAIVPIACLLTILARSAIDGNVPVFAFEASIQGSGKTMQGDVVHIIATGRLPPHASFPEDETDQRKEILTLALSGSPVGFFDNVKGLFGGAPIEGAVTSGEIRQRLLGSSVDAVVRWIATLIVTGNNMRMTEDMLRRSLVCRVEPDEEDPTKRKAFAHDDLPAWVASERERLIVCALTILRAYAVKGYPDTGAGIMQSFHGWSRIVPGALMFAGGANVLDAVGNGEDAGSDEAAAFALFVRELRRLHPGRCTARGILSAVYPAPKDGPPDGWDDFRTALETLAPGRNGLPPTPKSLGEALAGREGQTSAGWKLRRQRVEGVRYWCVEQVKRQP